MRTALENRYMYVYYMCEQLAFSLSLHLSISPPLHMYLPPSSLLSPYICTPTSIYLHVHVYPPPPPPPQMCEAVRELDRTQAHYKVYIDQLLAVVLETNSALLEGMPRLQQSTGLRMELLRMASRGEVRVHLYSREMRANAAAKLAA